MINVYIPSIDSYTFIKNNRSFSDILLNEGLLET